MADTPPDDAAGVDALTLAEQAEAEAAEAEALAEAARARARAIRLRNDVQAWADDAEPATEQSDAPDETPQTSAAADAPAAAIDAAPASAPQQSGQRRRLPVPQLSTILAAAAIVGICGLLAASGLMVWNHHEATRHRERAETFVAAARQGVVNMISLDFNDAKKDVQRVIDSSTGEFRDDFAKRADDFAEVVEKSEVVTKGSVNSAAIESMSKDSAVVLVAATSHVTNIEGAKQEPRVWRLRVTVAADAGQFKMSKVEFVP